MMGLCALLAVSCGTKTAKIDGTLSEAPQKQVIVKLQDVSTYTVLDTVKTDAAGHYSYKVPVNEGQPEFVYIYYGDTKISSLLLQAGDVVKVVTDTLGNGTVEGSEESVKLQENEKKFAKFLNDASNAQSVAEYNQIYIDYYRSAVKYVMSNPKSLTTLPVLFQNVTPDFPVFSQNTDALHFRSVADSIKAAYPDSKYVKVLENEAKRRENVLSFNAHFTTATELAYPDIKSKDINGNDVRLSEVDAKAVLVRFWSVGDPDSKIFNVDNLLPIYEKFHGRGFEIFSVSLDTDKAAWANIVRNQNLPWINVNDGLGTASAAVTLYNVSTLPQNFLILNGEVYGEKLTGDKALISLLDKTLK